MDTRMPPITAEAHAETELYVVSNRCLTCHILAGRLLAFLRICSNSSLCCCMAPGADLCRCLLSAAACSFALAASA